MTYGQDKYLHAIEAKVLHKAPKSWIIETTLGGKYILPFKCVLGGEGTLDARDKDEDGNYVFEVNEWWWNKRHDFEAE